MLPNAWKQGGVRRCIITLLFACAACLAIRAFAQPVDVATPGGSTAFGTAVAVLPNGNFVVTDPFARSSKIGAVYLFGHDGTLISYFTGSTANDHVGSGGIFVLANGNFVVASPDWTNNGQAGAGAVTWVDGGSGLAGSVSPANSLVGSTSDDHVGGDENGYANVVALPGGNYVVSSANWNNAKGAVTWANGTTGLSGPVSPENSLVGSVAGDKIGGIESITVLTNGNCVVRSQSWSGGAGAVTWISSATGLSGPISAENSLVGPSPGDAIGGSGIVPLSNANYIVASPDWNGHRGAVTWGAGHSGVRGFVSASNSLVGTAPNDYVGIGVTALTNGNYVAGSAYWSDGMGAVTWADGATGMTGEVSTANSLVGTVAGDRVGNPYALSNGNYVVVSSEWRRGAAVGTVTWANGSSGTTGAVSLDNSLVGNEIPFPTGSGVLIDVVSLPNGNYVISRPFWNNGAATSAGAVTWADGTKAISGTISAANSLVGTSTRDEVGSSSWRVTALTSGNYVVSSPNWSNGAAGGAGAATWANGRTGLTGEISSANSLVGTNVGDNVGYGVTALANGNYVVKSNRWSLVIPQPIGSAIITAIGAATWGSGITGIAGSVSPANSLVGSRAGDSVGFDVTALSDGDYVVVSPYWANGNAQGAGAITWADGSAGLSGVVSGANSLIGPSAGDMLTSNYGSIDGFHTSYNGGVTALPNGGYVVTSPIFGGQVGAVSLGSRDGGPTGAVSASNSVLGTAPGSAGQDLVSAYDTARDQLIVGVPGNNKVSIIKGNNADVSALNVNQHGLTGSWYNPATGGQGIEMEMYSDAAGPGKGVMFGGWFTFAASAAAGQRWYALQGATNRTTTISLDIATGYAGNFAAPPAVAGSIVGQAALQFIDCNKATLTYNFTDGSGRTGSIPLTRLTANVTCTTSGDNATAPADYLLSGSWFDSSTPGQGLIFDFNPIQTYLFAAWYTFAPNGAQGGGPGSQRWYTLQSGQLANGTTSLDDIGIYTANGGIFNDPAATTTERVGTASIAFSSCSAMTLNYVFTSGDNLGRSGTISLARTGPAPAGCSR